MEPVRDEDERPHAPSGDTQWSEAYLFHVYDPREAIGMRARLAVRPNEGAIDVGLNFFLADGGFVACRHLRPQSTNTAELEVEGVRVALLEPLRRWRISYDGPAHALRAAREASRREAWTRSQLERLIVELEFEATQAPARFAGAGGTPSALVAPGVALERFEQPGRFSGTVWISGDEYAIDALGARGKSWGLCEWQAPRLWRSFSMQFAPDRAAAALWMRVGDEDLVGGYVARDGRTTPLAAVELATVTEPDSYLQKSLRLTLVDGIGARHEISAEMLQVAPLPSSRNGRDTMVCDGFARFTYDGMTGYGVAEYLHQLDAKGQPVVPVG
jgi:hypothetical protein